MDERFDFLEFADFARGQWRTFAICCGIAVGLAATISFALPRRYTASASILIEPPAGNDPRAATAVSPVYLDSLRTYERLASSDTLFVRALDHLKLRTSAPVSSLKRSILKVSKPTNTKILEISATLDDPRKAQALAQFVAEETVRLSKSFDAGSEDDVTLDARKTRDAAQARLRAAERARDALSGGDSVRGLEDRVANNSQLRGHVLGDLAKARADLAYFAAQQPLSEGGPASNDKRWIETQIAALQGRVKVIESQDRDLASQLAADNTVLEKRKNQSGDLDAEVRAARTEFEAATSKLNEIRTSTMFRRERLYIIDPGVVPERPSFPNIPLNLVAALFASLVGASAWTMARFSYRRMRSVRTQHAYMSARQ